jgi:hypothetical protein
MDKGETIKVNVWYRCGYKRHKKSSGRLHAMLAADIYLLAR